MTGIPSLHTRGSSLASEQFIKFPQSIIVESSFLIGCFSSNILGKLHTLIESEISRYTGDIVKQWVCEKVFNKNKASKDVLTAFQACALHKAFLLITRDKPIKKDEKWQMLSELSVDQSENFISHNFEGVKRNPITCRRQP